MRLEREAGSLEHKEKVMNDEEFDLATIEQVARVFAAAGGLSRDACGCLVAHACYAASLCSSMADRVERPLREIFGALSVAFANVGAAYTDENNTKREPAQRALQRLLDDVRESTHLE